jgi:hypothetical protein
LYPWLIPLAVPLILVCLALIFLPCLINILQNFFTGTYYCHLPDYIRGTTQGLYVCTNFQAWQKPLIAPDQMEVVRRQIAPPIHTYISKSLKCWNVKKHCSARMLRNTETTMKIWRPQIRTPEKNNMPGCSSQMMLRPNVQHLLPSHLA